MGNGRRRLHRTLNQVQCSSHAQHAAGSGENAMRHGDEASARNADSAPKCGAAK